jgi:hypothetical protein
MRTTPQWLLSGLLVAASAAAVSVALLFAQGAPDPAIAVIHFQDRGGKDPCGLVHKTYTVYISKANRPTLQFTIVNDCKDTVKVAISAMTHSTTPGAEDPFTPTPGNARERTVPGNQTNTSLQLSTRNNAVVGLWTYTVSMNGATVDPKVEIDP